MMPSNKPIIIFDSAVMTAVASQQAEQTADRTGNGIQESADHSTEPVIGAAAAA